MDIEVVRTVGHSFSRAEVTAIKCHIGSQCGKLTFEFRSRIGNLVCRCECGETISLTPKKFASGNIAECKSCQKWRKKKPAQKILGMKLYKTLRWRGYDAYKRCEVPGHKDYKYYGAKGRRFLFNSLDDYILCYISHASVYGWDKQVDRIDNDGHYEPANVRLVTPRQNMSNRSNSFLVCGRAMSDIVEDLGFVADHKIIQKAGYFFKTIGSDFVNDPLHADYLHDFLISLGFENTHIPTAA